MANRISKVGVLKSVGLFSACTTKELTSIAGLVEEVAVPKGTKIVEQGGPGREAFAIIDGTADVKRDGMKLATLGPGTVFGEMSLLDQEPRSATVSANTDMRLYSIDARAFSKLLDQHPAVARKILRVMAQRIRALEDGMR